MKTEKPVANHDIVEIDECHTQDQKCSNQEDPGNVACKKVTTEDHAVDRKSQKSNHDPFYVESCFFISYFLLQKIAISQDKINFPEIEPPKISLD